MYELMAEPARVFFVMAGLIGIALAVAVAAALILMILAAVAQVIRESEKESGKDE